VSQVEAQLNDGDERETADAATSTATAAANAAVAKKEKSSRTNPCNPDWRSEIGAEHLFFGNPELRFSGMPDPQSNGPGGRPGPEQGEGLVLLLAVLCSNFRHLRYPQAKLVCLAMVSRMVCLGRCADEVILQRLVPMVCMLGLEDQAAPGK
jgi:hypothetical protein